MSVSRLNRRQILSLGTGLAAAGLAGKVVKAGPQDTSKPAWAQTIESIINAQGTYDNGVLSITVERTDIGTIQLIPPVPGIAATAVTPPFQVHGDLTFQQIGSGVMTNSDMCLKPSELDPFISALISHGIVFQAEHQHLYDFSPMVWFVHFRQMGDPVTVAQNVKAALNVTSTPFPQAPPPNPTTPLPADRMAAIIGVPAHIEGDGVVLFEVPRANPIVLGGVQVSPFLNVDTPIYFQPVNGSGMLADAIPDFGMIASEINPVVGLMRSMNWDSGCLYNQETDEQPQLYFDHMYKQGDPIQLAIEIRQALDLMAVSTSPTNTSAGYSLSAPTTAKAGGTMTVTWTAPAGHAPNDYIGLYSNTAGYWFQAVGGGTSGSFTVPVPAQPGMYFFRYVKGNVWTVVAQTPAITVS